MVGKDIALSVNWQGDQNLNYEEVNETLAVENYIKTINVVSSIMSSYLGDLQDLFKTLMESILVLTSVVLLIDWVSNQ